MNRLALSPGGREGPGALGLQRFRMGIVTLVALWLSGAAAPAAAQRSATGGRPGETVDEVGRVPGVEGALSPDSLTAWARRHLETLRSSEANRPMGMDGRLERIRAMYFLSVEERDWSETARDSLLALKPALEPDTPASIIHEAYRGALQVIRAKHARWPTNKLKHLNRGAEILDALVAEHPQNLEVRYLRLASYLFLPFFLRRDDSVAADLEVLTRELPDQPEAFSPTIYRGVLSFVLENGNLGGDDRHRFERVLLTRDFEAGAGAGAGVG